MVRIGFAGILVIPLVFLILSFVLPAKFVFLVLWIISLIALVVYLICVEYVHDRIVRQLEMSGLEPEELVKKRLRRETSDVKMYGKSFSGI